jgi:hypothetical protein
MAVAFYFSYCHSHFCFHVYAFLLLAHSPTNVFNNSIALGAVCSTSLEQKSEILLAKNSAKFFISERRKNLKFYSLNYELLKFVGRDGVSGRKYIKLSPHLRKHVAADFHMMKT